MCSRVLLLYGVAISAVSCMSFVFETALPDEKAQETETLVTLEMSPEVDGNVISSTGSTLTSSATDPGGTLMSPQSTEVHTAVSERDDEIVFQVTSRMSPASVEPQSSLDVDSSQVGRHISQVAVVGTSVSLACPINVGANVRWERYPLEGADANLVYGDCRMHSSNPQTTRMEANVESGRFTLIINDLQLNDAGVYVCLSPDDKSRYFSINVLKSDPQCSTNASQSDAVMAVTDYIAVDCTVKYSGIWDIDLLCATDHPESAIPLHSESVPGQYSAVVAASRLVDSSALNCFMSFTLSAGYRSVMSDVIPVRPETPVYDFVWRLPFTDVNTKTHRLNGRTSTSSANVGRYSITSPDQSLNPTAKRTAPGGLAESKSSDDGSTLSWLTIGTIASLVSLLSVAVIIIIVLCSQRRRVAERKSSVVRRPETRRALPPTPDPALCGARPRQTVPQSRVSICDDDGHYTDIRSVIIRPDRQHPAPAAAAGDEDGGGHRVSYVHYHRLDYSHMTTTDNQQNVAEEPAEADNGVEEVERRRGYEGLDRSTLEALREPRTADHYVGLADGATAAAAAAADDDNDADDVTELIEMTDHNADGDYQDAAVVVIGHEAADKGELETARAAAAERHFDNVDVSSTQPQQAAPPYLELIYIPQLDDLQCVVASGYEAVDRSESERARAAAQRPHDYTDINSTQHDYLELVYDPQLDDDDATEGADASKTGVHLEVADPDDGEGYGGDDYDDDLVVNEGVVEGVNAGGGGYEGLEQARQPRDYVDLNLEDLYSRPNRNR